MMCPHITETYWNPAEQAPGKLFHAIFLQKYGNGIKKPQD